MEPSQPKAPKHEERKSSTLHDQNKVDELKRKISVDSSGDDEKENESQQTPQSQKDELQSLKDKIEEQQEIIDKNKENLMRVVADFENSKKRLERDKEETIKFANEKVINEFLPVFDSLEMTIGHVGKAEDEKIKGICEGVDLVLKQFLQVFSKCGVTVIEGEKEPFDPHTQEAISIVPSQDVKPDHVVQVNRKGFKLNEKVIRPAMVTVASST